MKSALGILTANVEDDARYDRLILMASSAIAGYCDCDFQAHEWVDECDGDGSNMLRLAHTPILSVEALSIDGASVPVDEIKLSADCIRFDLAGEYSARLRSGGRIFPVGVQNVQVAYTAGYNAVPADISDACIFQVAHLINTLNKQGIVSEGNTTAGVTTVFGTDALAPAVKARCNKFRPRKVAVVA